MDLSADWAQLGKKMSEVEIDSEENIQNAARRDNSVGKHTTQNVKTPEIQ